jgi:hypothetical protein
MLMGMTVYNPEKGRLETVAMELTPENTTWFDNCRASGDIAMITDFDGDLLVSENNRNYPVRIYNTSRESICCDRKKAKELLRRFLV